MLLTLFPKREKGFKETLKIINRKLDFPDYFEDFGKLIAYNLNLMGFLEENDAYDEHFTFKSENKILIYVYDEQLKIQKLIDKYKFGTLKNHLDWLSVREIDWIDLNIKCDGHGKKCGREFISAEMSHIDYFMTYKSDEDKKIYFKVRFTAQKNLFGTTIPMKWRDKILETKIELKEENIIPLCEALSGEKFEFVKKNMYWIFDVVVESIYAVKYEL